MAYSINFLGIAPRYINNSGQFVIPIAKNPSKQDIEAAIEATKITIKPMEGYNGEVFWLGKDLVVKRYKGKNAFSDNPDREIDMLDKMYDHNLKFENSQQGMYAFKTKNNTTYLVSTRVMGQNPVYPQNQFNKENLKATVDLILQMDMGTIVENSSRNGFSDRCRFMNYDFNGKNINITPNSTGLYDFEYSRLDNIDELIRRDVISMRPTLNPHRSDTSGLPSSLRSFEFYAFSEYLKSMDNIDELFNDYLEIKGKYHEKMAEFYQNFARESCFTNVMYGISSKEYIHSTLLKKDSNGKIPNDIKISEAIKIQMANFVHEQSPACSTGKINPQQLRKFTKDTIEFFYEQYDKAIKQEDSHRCCYYQDCIELFYDWEQVNLDISRRITDKDKDTLRKITHNYIETIPDKINYCY